MDNHLTRSEIDAILEGMTARDIFAVVGKGGTEGAEVAGKAFEAAATRQGYGELVLDRVKPADAVYLAQALAEVFSAASPKADDTGPLPDSSVIGESVPNS